MTFKKFLRMGLVANLVIGGWNFQPHLSTPTSGGVGAGEGKVVLEAE